MNSHEIVPFEHDGKEYEIRVISDGATIYIRAFYQNRTANGYSYQVGVMKYFDLKKLMGFDAIKDLVDSAKQDVVENRWERFLEVLEKSEKD